MQQGHEWGGVELGLRWQNFRYLRCATLTAVFVCFRQSKIQPYLGSGIMAMPQSVRVWLVCSRC